MKEGGVGWYPVERDEGRGVVLGELEALWRGMKEEGGAGWYSEAL